MEAKEGVEMAGHQRRPAARAAVIDDTEATSLYSEETENVQGISTEQLSSGSPLAVKFIGSRSRAERWGNRVMYVGYFILYFNCVAIIMVVLNMLGLTGKHQAVNPPSSYQPIMIGTGNSSTTDQAGALAAHKATMKFQKHHFEEVHYTSG